LYERVTDFAEKKEKTDVGRGLRERPHVPKPEEEEGGKRRREGREEISTKT